VFNKYTLAIRGSRLQVRNSAHSDLAADCEFFRLLPGQHCFTLNPINEKQKEEAAHGELQGRGSLAAGSLVLGTHRDNGREDKLGFLPSTGAKQPLRNSAGLFR